MSERYPLALRQADQARTDFAAIEERPANSSWASSRDCRRAAIWRRTALGIIISTAALVILWAEAFWRTVMRASVPGAEHYREIADRLREARSVVSVRRHPEGDTASRDSAWKAEPIILTGAQRSTIGTRPV